MYEDLQGGIIEISNLFTEKEIYEKFMAERFFNAFQYVSREAILGLERETGGDGA